MREKEIEIFTEMLLEIGEQASNKSLTGILASRGNKYAGELMVIGRAVYGWECVGAWNPKDERNISREFALKKAEEVMKSVSSDANGECPMLWVEKKQHQFVNDLNPNRSAFWRATKNILKTLGIVDFEKDTTWPSHLVWSNLYKVAPNRIAPSKVGNPSPKLCTIQFKRCLELLQEEIIQFKPKRILMLTGINWAGDFLKNLNLVKIDYDKNFQYIESFANIKIGNIQSKLVVAQHPQGRGKYGDIIVKEICSCFNK